jgi:hypothetical protein
MSSLEDSTRAVLIESATGQEIPLLLGNECEHQEPSIQDEFFRRFKLSFLGLTIGIFLQLASVGSAHLLVAIWGIDVIAIVDRGLLFYSLVATIHLSGSTVILQSLAVHVVTLHFCCLCSNPETA